MLARVCEQPENHARGGASFGATARLMALLSGNSQSIEAQLAALQGLAAMCAHARLTAGQLHEHGGVLRLLLAFATGQRGSAPRLRETALEALCWLCGHRELQAELVATELPIALARIAAPGETIEPHARRDALLGLNRLLRAPHQRARAQLLGAKGGSMAGLAASRAAVKALRAIYREQSGDDGDEHVRCAAAVALCFVAADGSERILLAVRSLTSPLPAPRHSRTPLPSATHPPLLHPLNPVDAPVHPLAGPA